MFCCWCTSEILRRVLPSATFNHHHYFNDALNRPSRYPFVAEMAEIQKNKAPFLFQAAQQQYQSQQPPRDDTIEVLPSLEEETYCQSLPFCLSFPRCENRSSFRKPQLESVRTAMLAMCVICSAQQR
jgi:hypothetical protein